MGRRLSIGTFERPSSVACREARPRRALVPGVVGAAPPPRAGRRGARVATRVGCGVSSARSPTPQVGCRLPFCSHTALDLFFLFFFFFSCPTSSRCSVERRFTPAFFHPRLLQIALAEDLVEEFLVKPSLELTRLAEAGTLARVLGSAAGAATASTAVNASLRAHLRTRLLCMHGVVCGAGVALPDLDGTAPPADSVNLVGSAAPVGLLRPETRRARETALGAMVEFLHAAANADPDTLAVGWMVCEALLAVGWIEHHNSTTASSAWSADERWVSSRPLSDVALIRTGFALEQAASGGDGLASSLAISKAPSGSSAAPAANHERARRRRPRWLMVEKALINLQWRASAAAYRWWLTSSRPVATPEIVPKLYGSVFLLAAEHGLHQYQDVRSSAGSAVERGLKRFPALTNGPMRIILRALAGLPSSPSGDDGGTGTGSLLAELEGAARRAAGDVARAVAADREDKELAWRTSGAAALMRTGRTFWRHAGASWTATAELVCALLAGTANPTPDVVSEVGTTVFVYSLRFYPPQGSPGDVADELVAVLLGVASAPETHWRHRAVALVMAICVLPSASASSVADAASCAARALLSDQPLLRSLAQVIILGLTVHRWANAGLLPSELRPGAPWPRAPPPRTFSPEAREAAVGAIAEVSTTGAYWPELFKRLVHAHVALSRGEGGSDGASRGGRMGGGLEDAMARLLGSNVATCVWPCGREALEATAEGWFLPPHAATIQALASIDPDAASAALREPTLAGLAASRDRDAPQVAAAGEVLAGLLSVGAAGEGGWALEALQGALASAPLDAIVVVGAAVLRHVIFHCSSVDASAAQRSVWEALAAYLVRSLGEAHATVAAAAGSDVKEPASVLRVLQYCVLAYVEGISVRGTGSDDPPLVALADAVFELLPDLADGAGGHLLRSPGSRAASVFAGSVLERQKQLEVRGISNATSERQAKRASEFMDDLVEKVRRAKIAVVVAMAAAALLCVAYRVGRRVGGTVGLPSAASECVVSMQEATPRMRKEPVAWGLRMAAHLAPLLRPSPRPPPSHPMLPRARARARLSRLLRPR